MQAYRNKFKKKIEGKSIARKNRGKLGMVRSKGKDCIHSCMYSTWPHAG
jgi:hypothetical protein